MDSDQVAEMQAAIELAVYDIEELRRRILENERRQRVFMPSMIIGGGILVLVQLYALHQILESIHCGAY